MIVCLCTGTTEREIREVIDAGAGTADQVRRACGAGGRCGTCRLEIQEMTGEASAGTSFPWAIAPGQASLAPMRTR